MRAGRYGFRHCGTAAVALAAAVAVAFTVTGCGGSGASPLGLDGSVGASGFGYMAVLQREPGDFTVILKNESSAPVTLIRGTIIPIAGFAKPRLTHLAIQTGRGTIGAMFGWPPQGIQLSPFTGYRIRPGDEALIAYSIQATGAATEYGAKGVSVTVREASGNVTVPVLGVGGICVMRSRAALRHGCTHRFQLRIEHQARPISS